MKNFIILFSAATLSLSATANNKMVVGSDNRIQIEKKDKTEAHEAIGLIFYETRGVTYSCTGTIVAPKVVLTAGHCIDYFANDYYFVPGQTSKLRKLNSKVKNVVKAKFWLQFPGYNKKDALTTDLGILVFDKEFKVRPLQMTTQYGRNEIVTISGYPDDKKDGTLWEDTGMIDGASYTIDTYSGQSGSALRNKNNEIIGVHSYANNPSKRNFACLLLPQHIEFIEKYSR